MKTFIEEKMQKDRLNQTEFARKVGISQSTVNNILSGSESIREDVKLKIAVAFGLDPRYFSLASLVADNSTIYNTQTALSEKEKRLLDAFRKLSEKRQDRFLETVEDMAEALDGLQEKRQPGEGLRVGRSS